GIGVFRHSRCGGTRHCTERVGHQVRAALQNRELAAKLQELVRRRTPHGSHGCTGAALWNSASAFHVGTVGASATIRTKPSTTLDSCTAPRRSKSGRYSSPGWWYRFAVNSSDCCWPQPSGRSRTLSPAPRNSAGTPAFANEK